MAKEYARELREVFRETPITQDVSPAVQARKALNRLKRRFDSLFSNRAPTIIERIFGDIDKSSQSSLTQSLKELSGGVTLKTPALPASLKTMMQAATMENVALIKSIPVDFHQQIEGAVMRSIQPGGNGLQDVDEALSKYGGITKRRAQFIARDQTSKVTAAMNSQRAQAVGVKKFVWVHSGGGAEPRRLHQQLSGQTFRFDDLPIIDERTGERGLPGQAINCRCTMRPLVDFGEDE